MPNAAQLWDCNSSRAAADRFSVPLAATDRAPSSRTLNGHHGGRPKRHEAMRRSMPFRQAAASRIIINAHRINQGAMPGLSAPAGESDFYFVRAEDPETAVQRILELVKTRIPKRFGLNPIRDVQVLCPMNRGGVRARSLNIELQAALNLAGERKVERFGWTFAPGDEVMQIENDYNKEVCAQVCFRRNTNRRRLAVPIVTQN